MTLYRKKTPDGYIMSWEGKGCSCGEFRGTGVVWMWWEGERYFTLYQCHECARNRDKQPLSLRPAERVLVFKGRPKGARVVVPRRTEQSYSKGGLTVFEASSDKAVIADGEPALALVDNTVQAVRRLQ